MNLLKHIIIITFTASLLLSCGYSKYYDASKAHHTASGFRNIEYNDSNKGAWDFIKWRWQRFFKSIPGADAYDFKYARLQPDLLHLESTRTTLTWIGHATFFLKFRGLNILTDPQFSNSASPVSWGGPARVIPAAYRIEDLPDIDVVLISHDHYDSLDLASVKALSQHNSSRRLTFIVPLGIKPWLEALNMPSSVDIVELDWQQSHRIGKVDFIAEPAQHWSKRGLFDAFERLWASFVIRSGQTRVFFAGDTGYSGQFEQLGSKYSGFDLALLPIGAYAPRWFMRPYHVNPDEAVRLHLDLRSKYSVAMHWGTFILSDERLDEPPQKLAEALDKYAVPASSFEVYKHGESRVLDF